MKDYRTELLPFNRSRFLNDERKITFIGTGEIGGKAHGLAGTHHLINHGLDGGAYPGVEVGIPAMTVIRTDIFDAFLKRNNLYNIAYGDLPDERIAHAFQQASLPFEILGDLRSLIAQVHTPLAVRSSSMLEDALHEPFAGVYGTKMTPNNQLDINARFNKLVEAIKFVYATTFFRAARDYIRSTRHRSEDEKMAVIIQEVVGRRFADRFYPEVSGVGRSHNYYAFGNADPADGIVNLALGLGKTIVDGGFTWSFSPAYPKADPPFNSIGDMLDNTQREFWCINMGKSPAYDPVRETEYMVRLNIADAEQDKTMKLLASTFDPESGRIMMGTGRPGPRLLNFAPLLRLNEIPLVSLVSDLMKLAEKEMEVPVEIEFAMTLSDTGPHKFGFLQVRPMAVSTDEIMVEDHELRSEHLLAGSERVLGNGSDETILDIVYIRKDAFDVFRTHDMKDELERVNETLIAEGKPYVLIGFGRWGTSDPTAGIPVKWGQISGTRAIVEASLAHVNFEQSQGSHFFHNVTGCGVFYFSVPFERTGTIDWAWLDECKAGHESTYVRHVRLIEPLHIKVDGRTGRGVILKRKP